MEAEMGGRAATSNFNVSPVFMIFDILYCGGSCAKVLPLFLSRSEIPFSETETDTEEFSRVCPASATSAKQKAAEVKMHLANVCFISKRTIICVWEIRNKKSPAREFSGRGLGWGSVVCRGEEVGESGYFARCFLILIWGFCCAGREEVAGLSERAGNVERTLAVSLR